MKERNHSILDDLSEGKSDFRAQKDENTKALLNGQMSYKDFVKSNWNAKKSQYKKSIGTLSGKTYSETPDQRKSRYAITSSLAGLGAASGATIGWTSKGKSRSKINKAIEEIENKEKEVFEKTKKSLNEELGKEISKIDKNMAKDKKSKLIEGKKKDLEKTLKDLEKKSSEKVAGLVEGHKGDLKKLNKIAKKRALIGTVVGVGTALTAGEILRRQHKK